MVDDKEVIALRLKISGVVQGVGFRPFIYRIAVNSGVRGYVRNLGGSDVEVFVEGETCRISEFLFKLATAKPWPAYIEEVEIEEANLNHFPEFKILKSGSLRKKISMIPPDFSICDDCLREILDEGSRWFNYPFNSCAWCGPRFSIMYSIPYDRENTSMRDFPLCENCTSEYTDPGNIRRFHAQGISCPECGPRMKIIDNRGEVIECVDPIEEAARLVDEGFIIGIKGLGGFHIACLATDDDVVLELRKRKKREQKPFALMALNVDVASKIILVNDLVRKLLVSPQRPIVLAPKRDDSPVSEYVAPGLSMLGVELAYTGIHYILLKNTKDKFLIMTSGNPRGLPMCTTIDCALKKLSEIADYFLVHNRKIVNRVDDSVVRLTLGKTAFIRRSRGYAPTWLVSTIESKKPIVAFGAMLSNTGAIGVGKYVIPTQFIGDCENIETIGFLRKALHFLEKAYGISDRNKVIVCDLHPEYSTTKLAEEEARRSGLQIIRVQHHHAHMASVMLEHRIRPDEEVVGIGIDGVGYGDDDKIWGGEVFLASYSGYRRVGHLEYHKMPGGDLATIYPVRMLVSILSKFMRWEEVERFLKNSIKAPVKGVELNVLRKLIDMKFTPETSSTGRVLDAFSALLGICYERTYEGEPAMKLEAYSKIGGPVISLPLRFKDGKFIVETSRGFEQAMEEMDRIDPRVLAFSMQYAIGRALGEIARRVAKRNHRFLVVSGGAAVNDYIIMGIRDAIENSHLTLLLNEKLPRGDGGVSSGQVVIAASIIQGMV